MNLASGTKLGPYEIASLLGAGGMGEVYRARDSRLKRDVAIKVLPQALSADADRLRRFEQEALATAALNHPNILAVFDIGTYESPIAAGSTSSQLYRHGNYDYVTGTVIWDPTNTNHALPDSLYLSSKPAFFGTNRWPWVDPVGTTKLYTLPAKARWDSGSPNP